MAENTMTLEVCFGQRGDLVGTLWLTTDGERSFSSFQYAHSWLIHPRRFAIAPSIPLSDGRYHFRETEGIPHTSALPSPLSDTVPDSWGRRLLDANARVNRRGILNEFNYLISIDDFSRMGALRLRFPKGSHFLSTPDDGHPVVPPILKIDSLVRDINQFEASNPSRVILARLLDAGTSLGGARPKCSVIDSDGSLSLAKFTSRHDTRPVERMEVLALHLARICGITVPDSRIEFSGDTAVAVIRRFDRNGKGRIPYLSGQSFLGLASTDGGTYLEFAELLREHAVHPRQSLHELFKRVSYTILVNNTDDHLRNHGLLYKGDDKWDLSPMFDVNPSPQRTGHLKTAIDDSRNPVASVELLLENVEFFDLSVDEGRALVRQQAQTIRDTWQPLGISLGLTPEELREYSPAFMHPEIDIALHPPSIPGMS